MGGARVGRYDGPVAATVEEDDIEPRDERIEVGGGLNLRVLRWDAARGSGGAGPVEGAPFLLVHGLASNARLWDGVAPRLAAAGHRVAAVDLRGHGRSDKPDGGYDFATISGDLRALIAGLGFERPVVAGQSWGAGVVLDLGVREPASCRGIVLVDGGLTDLRDAFATWDICWQRLAPPQLVGLPVSDVEAYFEQNHADWPEAGIEASLANFEIRPDGTIAPWLTRDRHRAILEAMWGQRTADLWAALRVPALILPVDGGEGDWTEAKRAGAGAAETAMRASGVPCRVEWFHGDHDIHAQHPAEVAEALLSADRDGLFSGPVPA